MSFALSRRRSSGHRARGSRGTTQLAIELPVMNLSAGYRYWLRSMAGRLAVVGSRRAVTTIRRVPWRHPRPEAPIRVPLPLPGIQPRRPRGLSRRRTASGPAAGEVARPPAEPSGFATSVFGPDRSVSLSSISNAAMRATAASSKWMRWPVRTRQTRFGSSFHASRKSTSEQVGARSSVSMARTAGWPILGTLPAAGPACTASSVGYDQRRSSSAAPNPVPPGLTFVAEQTVRVERPLPG